MTALLSAISGQFTSAWILGALFPSVIFVFLFLVFVAPLLPPGFALAAPAVFGTDWNALSITFATLVLSALLFSLDTQIIQMYEGYPWQNSLLGRWMKGVQRRKLQTLQTRAGLLFALMRDRDTPDRERMRAPRSETERRLPMEFHDDGDFVLPTRLGNVLRAFEQYPFTQYGMDAIYLWPRLVACIPESYATAIGGARTSLVFLLSLSFLGTVLGLATLAAGLVYLPPDPGVHVWIPAAGFLLASLWLYQRSFAAAADWGHYVKGAFDLYRWGLLDQLGYQQKPRTREAERELWERITWQIVFGDQRVALNARRPWVDYADPPAPAAVSVRAQPADVGLELTRAVDGPGWLREVRVRVLVRNTDADRPADAVVVTDTLPQGMAYRWGSARVDGTAVVVEGTGPYRFHLGRVPAGAIATLTYLACATHFGNGS
jgi:uncharacterized repeat protein (TIGR01451 family)